MFVVLCAKAESGSEGEDGSSHSVGKKVWKSAGGVIVSGGAVDCSLKVCVYTSSFCMRVDDWCTCEVFNNNERR